MLEKKNLTNTHAGKKKSNEYNHYQTKHFGGVFYERYCL